MPARSSCSDHLPRPPVLRHRPHRRATGAERRHHRPPDPARRHHRRSVYLRATKDAPFTANGEVSLANAAIDGQLALDGATLRNPQGIALNAQGARIDGDVILTPQGPHPFQAMGEVRFASAEITGQLDLTGARLAAENRPAFAAQRMQVGAEFFWQEVTTTGTLHLPSAHVGDLVDDLASWPDGDRTYLDGLTYDRITRGAPPMPPPG